MASKVKINYIRDFKLCDRDHFRIVKGFSILAALCAAVAYMLGYGTLWEPAWNVCAAVFLFCSGFGVAESAERKGGLFHYWENKVIKVWLPSLVSMVILAVITYQNPLAWIAESALGLKGTLLYLIFGGYAVFWVLSLFVESRAVQILALYAAAVIAVLFVPSITVLAVCFPTGVLFSKYGMKRKIREAKMSVQVGICLGCLALAAAGWVFSVLTQIPYAEDVFLSVAYLFSGIFLILAIYTFRKIGIFGIFSPVGFISFGLYLFYEKILYLLGGARDWQSMTIVLAILFAVATAFSWLRELLVMMNKNARRRKATHLKGKMW